MARAIVRDMDPAWIRSIFAVALKPDAIFYLRVGIDQLVPRVIFSRGFDYWESGMDLYPGRDMYDSFCSYQQALLTEFDRFSQEYSFETVDASAQPKVVFAHLKASILRLLDSDSRDEYIAGMNADSSSGRAYGIVETRAPTFREATKADLDLALHPVAAHSPNGNGNGHGRFHELPRQG
jgi:dTMP kinase